MVGSGQTGHTITTTVATAAGDDIIVAFGDSGNHAFDGTSITDSAGNAYVADANVLQGTQADLDVYRAVQPTKALPVGSTISGSLAAGFTTARTGGLAIKVPAGSLASSPLDQEATNSGTGSPTAGPTAALAQADELVIGLVFWSNNSSTDTWAAETGFTNLGHFFGGSGTNWKGIGAEWQETSSTAAVSIAPTETTNGFAAAVVTYKVATGPTTVHGTASNVTSTPGQATGTARNHTFEGTASSSVVTAGAAAGTVRNHKFSGTASSLVAATGQATGSASPHAIHGTASGLTGTSGTATGSASTHTVHGTASSPVPSSGAAVGVASAHAIHGAAAGPTGTSGAATGVARTHTVSGSGSGSVTTIGHAVGNVVGASRAAYRRRPRPSVQ